MAKKSKSQEKIVGEHNTEQKKEDVGLQIPDEAQLPKEVKEKLEKIKGKVEKFKDAILKKFDKYILGVALMPPPKPKEGEEVNKDNIYVLVVVDDSDSKRMSKEELKSKLLTIIEKTGEETDKNLIVQTLILSEIWQNCYDAKYGLLQMIAMSAPVFDRGLLRTLKVTEVHKSMVLKKFEKYIVSYVLGGSIYKGTAREESDIDIFIIVDDTDVKRMTRGELVDKLRAIMYGMAGEAGMITGVQNNLHLQVWILTDYWDALKESSPVIVDVLRDGIPLYDRGMFLPWKQLLLMGKVRPSSEAIDMFMSTGDQALQRVKYKLKEIGMDDIFLAILTPTQAAMMLYGIQPPSPKETPALLRDTFLKEGLLEEKYIKILEDNLKIRKDIEYGIKKELSGKEVDKLLESAEDYLKRIKVLFEAIEKRKEKENLEGMYDAVVNVTRDALKSCGVEKVKEEELVGLFDDTLIATSKISANYLKMLKELLKIKAKYENKEFAKVDMAKVRKQAKDYIKSVLEYIQRTRARELEKLKIRVKSKDSMGEIVLAQKKAFIIKDMDKNKKMMKAALKEDGSLDKLEDSSIEEMDKEFEELKKIPRFAVKPGLFESIKKIFGEDVEIFMNY